MGFDCGCKAPPLTLRSIVLRTAQLNLCNKGSVHLKEEHEQIQPTHLFNCPVICILFTNRKNEVGFLLG